MNNPLELSSLEERARIYRHHAAQALQKAQASEDGLVRAEYLAQAANWHHLADDIERSMRLANLDHGLDPPAVGENGSQADRHH